MFATTPTNRDVSRSIRWCTARIAPNSNIVTAQGGLNTGRTFNAGICAGSNLPLDDLTGSATCGTDGQAGDYLYGDRNFFHMLSGGIWGLIRVHADDQSDLARLPGK